MYCVYMRKIIKTFVIIFCIYSAVFMFHSEQSANFMLALLAFCFIPWLILRRYFQNSLFRGSIRLVPIEFVQNKSTIANQNCIIKYTPDEKIFVMDSLVTRQTRDLRSFTISEKDTKNLNRCWNYICRIFDEQTYFDTIVSLFEKEKCNVKIVLIPSPKNSQNNTQKDPEIPQTQNEKIILNTSENEDKTAKNNIKTERIIDMPKIENQPQKQIFDMSEIKKAEDNLNKQNKDEVNLIDLANIGNKNSSNNKININTATSEQIATLPGINIVGAKKVIEYRNKEGYFKSIDEFIDIAGVKSHFVSPIKEIIIIDTPKTDQIKQNTNERIVDL